MFIFKYKTLSKRDMFEFLEACHGSTYVSNYTDIDKIRQNILNQSIKPYYLIPIWWNDNLKDHKIIGNGTGYRPNFRPYHFFAHPVKS